MTTSPPPWQPDQGAYEAARLAWFLENGAVFRPASGYRTKAGAHRWRVYADPIPGSGSGACELSDARGARRLFKTLEAAARVAEQINTRQKEP